MINEDNERVWVKLHFRTQQGIENYTAEEAEEVIGKDRESSHRETSSMQLKKAISLNGNCISK
jgi:catalase